MKFVDEYRNAEITRKYVAAIARITTRPWKIMEICGGQTHSIVKYGIDKLLPPEITLIHGPGCPVCVTSVDLIDKAIALAANPEVIFCSFGDMLRIPGSHSQDLLSVKAGGGDVRIVYSPLDAIKIAQQNPERQVVFFAVGFETTVPTTAMAVYRASQLGIDNFSLLVAHVLVPPAMELILAAPNNCVDGFLAAGHVCTVTGYQEYQAIAQKYHTPIVVTGFEPVDILQGIYMCLKQLETGRVEVENQYARSVSYEGNQTAQRLISEVFETVPRQWRGIGTIETSGLRLQNEYSKFDALNRFRFKDTTVQETTDCISGAILQGIKKPHQCQAFGKHCTPEHPLGAPMVSSEGACAAYYRYRQLVS
ncbi:hydrogenase formation protein HypD [Pleurocapsales cyanobacterium LEGE 10410]|nr:hydrogenase formation protein HypD [Pleurocapsales cyanobacterium LEGE 10410]